MKQIRAHINPPLRNDRSLHLAWLILVFFVLLAVLAPFLANENPIRCTVGNETYYPIISDINWKSKCASGECDMVRPMIPFSPQTIDIASRNLSPSQGFGKAHYFGTDGLGRDVAAGVVYGARTAVFISFFATFLALLFGGCYGLVMGYFANDRLRYARKRLVLLVVMTGVILYVMAWLRNMYQAEIISFVSLLGGLMMSLLIAFFTWRWGARRFEVRDRSILLDEMGMRFIDLLQALPGLFIILLVLQLFDQGSSLLLIGLIAFLLSPVMALHARAEVLRHRNKNSVRSAIMTGKGDLHIWRYDIIPFMVRPLFVTLAFSIAGAILLEATLSFLGIGLAVEHVSWGTLIKLAQQNSSNWWLLFFPSACLVALIWSVQRIGRHIEVSLREQSNG